MESRFEDATAGLGLSTHKHARVPLYEGLHMRAYGVVRFLVAAV